MMIATPHADDAGPADDPRPLPPEPPAPNECCQSGCIPCVYDMYDEAREQYREALAAWEARQRARQG